MRRKSERNKGKSSPEKKPEKPTRKSTRRRTKKSPSTTPERENPPETDNKLENETSESTYKIQTRLHTKDPTETVIDDPTETKVTSTEQIPDEIIDDPGSVWKVARADASPGEIQKLKLCRQRNLSETSDISLGKKRVSSKNDGSGSCGGGSGGGNDSVVEEADSADEKPPTSSADKYNIDNYGLADDTSSTTVGRDSGEEVSDSKEIPPETTTVDMSDVKQKNIDQEEEKPEQPVSTDGIGHKHDDDHHHDDAEADAADDGNAEINVKTEMKIGDAVGQKVLDDNGPAFAKALEETGDKENAEKEEEEKDNAEKGEEEKDNAEKGEEGEEKEKEKEEEKKEEEKKEDAGKIEESVDLGKSQSSDDEEKPKIECENEETSKNLLRTRSGRRKHRDKYRDSSNSDTGESEDEQERCIDAGDDKKDGESEDVGRGEDEEVKEDKKEEEKEEVVKVEEGVKEKVETGESEKDGGSGDAQINVKPAKVNLKRSFTSRISTDESKRDDIESTNDASHDKENHVIEDSKTIPKRRRWGTALSADIAPILSISTDSLKALVPGAKPLSMNEVRLTKDDDDDRERRREKRYTVNECEKGKEEIEAKNDTSKDNHIVARRKISIVKDTPQLISPSPPVAQPTNILLIKNLVRPFTLNQIKELLSRTGTIVENGFWMDRIKSKCFVEYSNEDQAFETRQALHGISWPMSNPKKLQVEYSTREEMDKMKESSKDQPLSRKLEASSGGDPWQQDWGRDDKANAAKVTVVREWDLGKEDGQHLLKDKDKEKKDLDKKRRQRSRSPTLEAHLPAPARKFKKKEDEPPPAKLLDDLFRKTKATPSIYWLPLTNEQIVVKEEMRRQHMAEHARRLEEMRRAERSRDNRRRRSPRK